MIVTIHQPDMMPWLGFFNKINKADIWVILDHTKNNPRDAAFWGRRVKILVNGVEKWFSLPLEKPDERGLIGVPISEMRYSNANPDVFHNALNLIESSYKKAPYFKEVIPVVTEFLLSQEFRMATRNLAFIYTIMEKLDIKTRKVISSELFCKESSTKLLAEILQKVGGTVYLCGGGAYGYQDDALLNHNGIEVRYNNFDHPIYPQFNSSDFHKGLSIIDCLMNKGFKKTAKLINHG